MPCPLRAAAVGRACRPNREIAPCRTRGSASRFRCPWRADYPTICSKGGQSMRRAQAFDWPFEVRPLTSNLGAEIVGVDVARDIDDDLFRAIYDAFLRD